MQRYCLGFAFDDLENVALIKKNRPDWQFGKLNGIGGHTEPGETILASMVREFAEETGLYVHRDKWQHYTTMLKHGTWVVEVYRAFDVPIHQTRTMTDEFVCLAPARMLGDDVLSNLHWLIPLALDVGQPNSPNTVVCNYAT